jgi:AcrR family transcriptional regulator
MPRKKGWGGNLPRDDDEARYRVISAAMRCIERQGPAKTTLADVATELSITRQTLYRLYPSTDDLFVAVGVAAAHDYIDRLTEHVAGITNPADAVVEGIAYTFERLPHEKFLGILLTTGRSETFIKGVTSEQSAAFGQAMFARMDVDWEAHGYGPDEMSGLGEFALRILESLVLDPPRSSNPTKLRAFLQRWVAPAVAAPTAVGEVRV